jgi:ribonuclease HI
MQATSPHYLLFSEVTGGPNSTVGGFRGQWRFVLEAMEGGRRVTAQDAEPGTNESRLELLAVVRGLEALDGPTHVTLITRSQYVSRGLRCGMGEWRQDNWHWERFGQWVPIRDHDLWQRIDRALCFHHVDCRVWNFTDKVPTHFSKTSGKVEQVSTCRRLKRCASKSQRVLNPERRVARRPSLRQPAPTFSQRSTKEVALGDKRSGSRSADLFEPFWGVVRTMGDLFGITKLAEI